jgi:hypothetical protein
MESLPVELQLMIVERAQGASELLSLWRSSIGLRHAVERGCAAWLRRQAVGEPLGPFNFGMAMRLIPKACGGRGTSSPGDALGRPAVSLTCEVLASARCCLWWVTCESGRNRITGDVSVARDYLVAKVAVDGGLSSRRFVSALDAGGVRCLVERILPAVLKGPNGCWTLKRAERVFRAACLGGFAADVTVCTCCVGNSGVCSACEPPDWESSESGWVLWSDRRPTARRVCSDWFNGVCDAAWDPAAALHA